MGNTRLVRSKALDTWRVPGAEHQVRPTTGPNEHHALIVAKLHEETAEVIGALREPFDHQHLTEEIGDVLAVLQGIASLHGIPWEAVLNLAKIKENRSGSFKIGLVWDQSL